MRSPKAPTPPDPAQTAGAQTATNIGTAIANSAMNNVNQVTPYGKLTYSQTGTTKYVDPNTGQTHYIPQYTATQTLSPSQARIAGANNAAALNTAKIAADQSYRLRGHLAQSIDPNRLPQGGSADGLESGNLIRNIADVGGIRRSYGTDFSEDRRRVEEALMSRLNPSLQRDQEALRSSLVNQGIREGSEAYDRAMNRFGEQSNDARMQAILAGGQEQSRLVGLEAQRAGFENQAQQQAHDQAARHAAFANQAQQQQFGQNMAIQDRRDRDRQNSLQEQIALRNQPINEIGALLGTGQVTQPSFVNTPGANIPTVDYAGLVSNNYNQQMNQYNQQLQSRSSLFGNLIGAGGLLGAAGIGA